MTTVRILVDDKVLGSVDVQEDDGVTSWSEDTQRRVIQKLMSQAIAKINGAYGLATTKEDPNT